MRLGYFLFSATLAAAIGAQVLPSIVFAQEPGSGLVTVAELPDAPRPQFAQAAAEPQAQQPSPPQSDSGSQTAPSATPAQSGAAQDNSSSQAAPQQPRTEKSQHEKAEEQIKEQEKQRVVGVVPQFNITYRSDAVSMTAGQKMRLAFRSSIDPVTFAAGFLVAGYHEADHDNIGFPWGIKGYGERSGAAYLDAFDGTMIGNGVLPVLFHQDPRYFRLGHGSKTHRLLYSLATNVIAKHDNNGKWGPNYSNVLGNIISGAISNLYYPPSDSGVGQTFTNGFIVTAEGGIGSIFDEFWPDISRKFFHRDPTHGLDAQARAADKANKETRQEQK
jgi:hypothetical protein